MFYSRTSVFQYCSLMLKRSLLLKQRQNDGPVRSTPVWNQVVVWCVLHIHKRENSFVQSHRELLLKSDRRRWGFFLHTSSEICPGLSAHYEDMKCYFFHRYQFSIRNNQDHETEMNGRRTHSPEAQLLKLHSFHQYIHWSGFFFQFHIQTMNKYVTRSHPPAHTHTGHAALSVALCSTVIVQRECPNTDVSF